MENITKLIRDIFSMDFDVIIPVSGSIIAVIVGFTLFSIRYFTFRHNQKKYEKRQKNPEPKPDTTTDDKEVNDP